MQRFIKFILKHKAAVLVVFLISALVCGLLAATVKVNYNMIDYLPEDANSTKGLKIIESEFPGNIPNLRVMIPVSGIPEALKIKAEIAALENVAAVNWLDDMADLGAPIESLPQSTVGSYYKNGSALFNVTITGEKSNITVEEIREIAGPDGAMSGSAVTTGEAMTSTTKELSVIMAVALPLIFIILILTTSSFIEPVLFLATIGIAIVLNLGTNAIFGEISFVTNAAAALLQLAVSMDYSIFLLHRFSEIRETGVPVGEAMVEAVKKSFSSILASGLTTVIGFAALIIMRFKIGPDMGYVMAKAIAFSLLCVLVLLPVIALLCYKIIDKTHHRSFLPKLKNFRKFVYKIRIPVLIIFVILSVPSFFAAQKNVFSYGASSLYQDENSQVYRESTLIDSTFGQSNQMVLIVPTGDQVKEKALSDELKKMPEVKSVISFSDMVGNEIPIEFIPPDQLAELRSENYSRMIVTCEIGKGESATFKTVEDIRAAAGKFYPEENYLVGEGPNIYDMKTIVDVDNRMVNWVAIVAVALILLITFKSISLPIILLLVIESSIWINQSFPYFAGENLFFIGFLIISSVQLGATIDYAILFTNRYNENRATLTKKAAAMQTVSDTTFSILTSAAIMSICGFLLGIISTNGVLNQLGFLLGRGAVLSAVMVLFVLPGLLWLFDKPVQKTSLGLKFLNGKDKKDA